MKSGNNPECPFCSRPVYRPVARNTGLGDVISGSCRCGAVYVCDPTGHNLGEAYSEALALARGGWDIDEMDSSDYLTEDFDYDLRTHSRIYAKGISGNAGKLIFVKINKDSKAADKAEGTASVLQNKPDKQMIRDLLLKKDFDAIGSMSRQDKAVIKWLISMSYDKQDELSWRAIEAMGHVSKALCPDSISLIRDIIRRLLWSMGEESGGIGWSAPEMIGEIVANCPGQLEDIPPILWSFRDEHSFRQGVVWGISKIASASPGLAGEFTQELKDMLKDSDPHVRGYAAIALGNMGSFSALEAGSVVNDHELINNYEEGSLLKKSLSAIVSAAIEKNNRDK
ncbi:MAG: HEAT repeat domain-containing protein [Nitrospiraceae bacterium]|nr:HEAT repeat domain-containing protein [Nitrospiraceae bacterium]